MRIITLLLLLCTVIAVVFIIIFVVASDISYYPVFAPDISCISPNRSKLMLSVSIIATAFLLL